MGDIRLGPWPLGIDHVSSINRLPTDDRGRVIALRDAVNVDLDEGGRGSLRAGYVQRLAGSFHSGWSDGARVFVMTGAVLNEVRIEGNAFSLVPLMTLASPAPVSFCRLRDRIVFSNLGTIGEIIGSAARQIGVPEPPPFSTAAIASGGMYAGRYGLVVTLVRDGEESAASALASLDVPAGGGIRLTGLTHALPMRVYRTGPNGDVLYRVAEVPVGMAEYALGNATPGRVVDTRHMARMIPGSIVREWSGRLVVARGRTLFFSEAMRHGLYSPRTGFVQFAHRIEMVEPVEGGIWLGTADGVKFLRGSSPDEMRVDDKDSLPPVPGTSTLIDTNILGGDMANGTQAALWLSPKGFVIGTADGSLVQPQAKRIRLADARGGIAVNDRRVIAITSQE